MNKGYYIHAVSYVDYPGVYKKIQDQISVLARTYEMQEIILESRTVSTLDLIISNLPLSSYRRNYDDALERINRERENGKIKPSFFYIRKQPTDRAFKGFIASIRRVYPEAKIILEIPTYPYKMEMLRVPTYIPAYIKDCFYNRMLKQYVDRMVTFTKLELFYNIKVIELRNGINVDRIIPVKHILGTCDDTIRLLSVASFRPCDGYERVIEGLHNYYKRNSRRVELHLVGDGLDLEMYKELVKDLKLDEYVFFYGKKTGEELDEIYNKASIGLGFFGAYKDGLEVSSALKVREYLAKGLPIASAIREDVFGESGSEFHYEAINDSSAVDIESITLFYDELINKYDYDRLPEIIRAEAYDRADMGVTLIPLINYISSEY